MAVTRKIPQRQCLGCGEMKDKKSMLRVIKTPEGPVERTEEVHISAQI